MIRLRSQKLLSGVSTLAVLAAFGAVDPVLAAGTTVSGPGNVPTVDTSTIVNTDQDFVTINTNANVASTAGNSFYNPLGEAVGVAATTALQIDDSVLQGLITNAGTLLGTTDGINADDSILAGIVNSGTITGTADDGIELDEVVLSGGINNTGTIVGGNTGIALDDDGIFSGGILNSGQIIGDNYGIYVDADWSFAGGINNTSTGTINAYSTAIYIDADSFSGGITNAGLIQSTSNGVGIYLTGDSFAGGINNSGTVASDSSYTAIYVNGGVFAGGITNSGLISSPSYYGIYVDADLFQGGINNTSTGTITAESTALYFNGDLFQGGVTNAGLIESTNQIGLYFNSGEFQGGINNAATGTILSDSTGIYVNNDTFLGGITNAGLIDADYYAIYIDNTLFEGGINNSGTILSTTTNIYFGGDTFNGGITNSGLIQATGLYAIYLGGTSFNGGIVNSGVMQADTSTVISLSNDTFTGGITNTATGTIISLSNGYGIDSSNTSFTGGINNAGLIQAGPSYTAINIGDTTFAGGITNSGVIASGSTAGYGIGDGTTSFSGGINNTATGTITGADTGIYIGGSTFAGGITNAGSIASNEDAGIYVNNTTFEGGINNAATGVIVGDSQGVYISNTTFTGGVNNAGLIEGLTSTGLYIGSTTFTGGVNNSGTIRALNYTGLYVSVTTFEGGITNSGLIDAGTSGIDISATNFTGGLNNTTSGIIQTTDSTGVYVSVTNWSGDFTNAGTILGATDAANSGYGVYVSTTNFDGNFLNSGLIVAGQTGNDGVRLTGSLFDGNVTNSGTITGIARDGLVLEHTLYTGNVVNSGKITAPDTGIYIGSGTTVAGSLTNSGVIDPSYGIYVDGLVQGGIFNSGTILATVTAIDVSSATDAHVITQTGGLIQGNSLADGTGTVETALDLDNGYEDTFNGNGGVLDGDVVGGGGDGDDFAVGGPFVYLRGTATDIDQLDFNSGRGAFGIRDADGNGLDDDTGGALTSNSLTFNAEDMNVNAGGTSYLGEATVINVNDDLTVNATGTMAFLVTQGTSPGTPGQVVVGDAASLAGTLHVVVDPIDFASGAPDTLSYDDLITVAGVTTGTFDDVTTSSLFWTAEAFYDDEAIGDVDVELNRIDFGDIANVLGLIETQNQQAVGDNLEAIFQDIQAGGPLGNEFDDLFAFLFGTTDGDTILAAYDEISGREHAQVVQASLTTAQLFNTIVGDQMDRTLLTMDGTRFANLGEQRYASAAALAATDASVGGVGAHGLNRGKSGVAVWARGFGQWGEVDGDVEAQGYDHDASGVAGGVEYAINNNASIGGAVVYSNNDVDFNTVGDEAEIDAWQLGAYGNYGFGNFYAGGTASFGWQDVSTVRTIGLPVPGAPFVAVAGYDASAWSLSGELGGIWQAGKVNVQPSVGLIYTGTDIDGFTETGNAGAYALNVTGSDADSFASVLALRGSGVWMMGKTRVVPDIKVGWRHEFEDDRQSITSIFVGDPTDTPFTIVSSEIQQDSALLSAGLTLGLTDNLEIFGDVNGLYNADASSTNASGGVRLTW